MIEPFSEKTHPIGNGTQKLYRFDNGYGASVVRFSVGPFGGSYGVASGLWELAVIKFDGDDWHINYETPITGDVLGHLTDDEVDALLVRIRDLNASGQVTS